MNVRRGEISRVICEQVEAARERRSTATLEDSERLRELLNLQEQRELTEVERDEAARLVEQEDLITLRKAKAIYLLKQRNALPDELAPLRS